MDNEKLYDFLVAAGKPMSIGQIHAQPEFSGVSRRELAQALQQLAAENIAFRSVRQGKAYYSANSADGVSRNPCQTNIANIASAMNAAFSGMQNPELQNVGNAIRAMDALFQDQEEEATDAPFRFTYNDGIIADCELYTIAIPDGFHLEMGRDGRDFVAWLPDGEMEDMEDARITLFAGQLSSNGINQDQPWILCPELLTGVIQASQWQMKIQTDRILGPSEMGEVPQTGEVSGSYLYSSNNYQIMIGFPDGIKQMRVLVQDAGMKRETYHQVVIQWIGTLKLKKGFVQLPPVDSEQYLPLTDENLKKWDDVTAHWMERLAAILNIRNQARVSQFRHEQSNGAGSMTLLKKDVRKNAEESMDSFEAACREMVAFLKRAAAHDPSEKNLLKVREIIQDCLGNLSMNFNLGEDKVSLTSVCLQEFKDALELPEIHAILAEQERIEAEKKAAEEAERKRREEERRLAEEKRKKEAEERRLAEEARRREEEERKRIERERREEERRQKELAERIAAEMAAAERKAAEEIAARERAEQKRIKRQRFLKKLKRTLIVLLVIAILLAILAVLTPTVILPAIENAMQYKTAQEYLEYGRYDEAEAAFRGLGDYKDSSDLALTAKYRKAEYLLETKNYAEAIAVWKELGSYTDSVQRAAQAEEAWREPDYQSAMKQMEQGEFLSAAELFASLGGYKDSDAMVEECHARQLEHTYTLGQEAYMSGDYPAAMEIFAQIEDYQDSRQMYQTCAYEYGVALLEAKEYANAAVNLGLASDYQDAAELKTEALYQYGLQLLQEGKYSEAISQLNKCGEYKETAKKLKDAKFNYAKQNLDRNNSTTRTYLKELISAKYNGAQKLYDDLYAWKVEILGFNNSAYNQSAMSSISKYQGMYCHFKVSGGEPGETIDVRAIVTAPNGQSGTINFYSCSDGSIWYTCFTYDTPYYGATGTMSVRIVDQNNKVLASGSVRVTN